MEDEEGIHQGHDFLGMKSNTFKLKSRKRMVVQDFKVYSEDINLVSYKGSTIVWESYIVSLSTLVETSLRIKTAQGEAWRPDDAGCIKKRMKKK